MGEEGDTSMETTLDMTGGGPVDSLILHRTIQEEKEWRNKEEWRAGIADLNSSVDFANEMIDKSNNMDILKKYKRKGVVKSKKQKKEELEGE